jgi:hypothetical protein
LVPALLHRPEDDGAFWTLAEPLRFEALCCAVEPEHPSRAAAMRALESGGKARILGWPKWLRLPPGILQIAGRTQ